MKNLALMILFSGLFTACHSPIEDSRFVTKDIDHFWEAYDRITATQDSVAQYRFIKELYIDKGSEGLVSIMNARRYTSQSYIEAINQYPLFWQSIREKTLLAKHKAKEIEKGVDKLREIYPNLKDGKVYFEIGVFRTPGTTVDSKVLIGAEMALGDAEVNTSEFPDQLNYFKNYLNTNPNKNIVFLNVHEFVHTQQKKHDYILLYRSIYEGVAEFIAEKATGKVSQSPAIAFGKANNQAVRDRFTKEIYDGASAIDNWLYNDLNNEFNTRDLGYYVGYAICEKYYDRAADKSQAIIEMIDLDYANEVAINEFVDQSGYFAKQLKVLKRDYEQNIPSVTGINQFENKAQNVDPNISLITIEFSTEMDLDHRGFEFGPLGQDHALFVQKFNGFSADKMSMSFEVSLEPNKQYQLILSDKFRNQYGVRMDPYLIDIKTADQ